MVLYLGSSHILGELSKIATHYGIIRGGKLIREMPASAMSDECRDFVFVKTNDNAKATLSSTVVTTLAALVAGVLGAVALGAVSTLILKKRDLV